ncbi:MAG TPA: alpha/beta hydrolase-fold protein [Solirubrobacterales bacterium]|nr:alpha/beta hydrolase-fold protein [Solirubrobacterales bacterium]
MSGRRGPTRRQIRQRRAVAIGIIGVVLATVVYLVLAATVLAPVDAHGARTTELTIHSRAVGRDLGVSVVEPARLPARGERSLVIFLHGRGGSEGTLTANEAVFKGLARLGARAPVIAFPDGGDHSYWHNRPEGGWGTYVMREVIPTVVKRFGIDPQRVAIGGISMGGFGAYDLALLHPRRFCAVGGHSPALWFEGGETAPGAFESAADFDRNDVVGLAHSNPDAFAGMRVWNDYGNEDPFRGYDEGFVEYLRADGANLSSHSWPGGHDNGYWNAHWPAYLRFYANALAHC